MIPYEERQCKEALEAERDMKNLKATLNPGALLFRLSLPRWHTAYTSNGALRAGERKDDENRREQHSRAAGWTRGTVCDLSHAGANAPFGRWNRGRSGAAFRPRTRAGVALHPPNRDPCWRGHARNACLIRATATACALARRGSAASTRRPTAICARACRASVICPRCLRPALRSPL